MAPSVLSMLLAVVDAGGGLLDVGPGRLEAGGVGDDQLVGEALLLGQGAPPWMRSAEYWAARSQGGPAGAEPEGGDHQPGVAEDGLGLGQALAFDLADDAVGVDPDVLEREGGRVAGPDAVLVLGFAVGEAVGVAVDDEPGRAVGGEGEDGVEVGVAAVGDPLLVAGDLVGDDLAVLLDAVARPVFIDARSLPASGSVAP